MNHLTEKQRKTLNDAHEILMGIMTEEGHYWTLTWMWTKQCSPSWDVAMFTPALNTQHTRVGGNTLADKIETGLSLIAEENAKIPTEEERKALRIKRLREELAKLGEAA